MIHLPFDSRPTALPFRLTACQKAKPLAEVGPNADCHACLAADSALSEEVVSKPSPAPAKPTSLPRLGAPASVPAPVPTPTSSLPRLGASAIVSPPSPSPAPSTLPRLGGPVAAPPVKEETPEEEEEEEEDEEGGFDLEALLAQLEVLKGLETVPGGTGAITRFEEKQEAFAEMPLHDRDRAVLCAVIGALVALDLSDVADHLVSIVEIGLLVQAEMKDRLSNGNPKDDAVEFQAEPPVDAALTGDIDPEGGTDSQKEPEPEEKPIAAEEGDVVASEVVEKSREIAAMKTGKSKRG